MKDDAMEGMMQAEMFPAVDDPIVEVKSFTHPEKETYFVNKALLTCTCPSFTKKHRMCKHILSVVGDFTQLKEFPKVPPVVLPSKELDEQMRDFDRWSRTRLSKNFIMRDFLYSTRAEMTGLPNRPEDDPEMVIQSGKALCARVLEPILAHWGRFAITFGYQSRSLTEFGYPKAKKHSSAPHQWDRGTFGGEVYARVDIVPYCVEDGEVSRKEFARWCMYNLDLDLLMQWWHSNAYCITISPKPRRVWLEWFPGGEGHSGTNNKVYMGEHYWTDVWPKLPGDKRPKFGPSWTSGKMRWGD